MVGTLWGLLGLGGLPVWCLVEMCAGTSHLVSMLSVLLCRLVLSVGLGIDVEVGLSRLGVRWDLVLDGCETVSLL